MKNITEKFIVSKKLSLLKLSNTPRSLECCCILACTQFLIHPHPVTKILMLKIFECICKQSALPVIIATYFLYRFNITVFCSKIK